MTDELVSFEALSDSAIRAEIDIKAAPDKVYAAWTDPVQFAKWFGPRTNGKLQIDQFDCVVGGRYDVTMLFEDGDTAQMVGNYKHLAPHEKIVFTWHWVDDGTPSYETLVTVEIAPTDSGSHLTLTHERFADSKIRDQHQHGWGPLLARLASVLAG